MTKEAEIGPLHDPVTWYKITYTGEQVAQSDFQNKGKCIVLEVPLCNLLTSICNFVPCDRVVQRAYCFSNIALKFKLVDLNYNFECDWLIQTTTLNVIGLLNYPITTWQVS